MFEYTIIESGVYCSHRYDEEFPEFDFHLHNEYEIYLLLSGDVHYFIENKKYILKKGDILVMNNKEIHKPTFTGKAPYERLCLHFNPQLAAYFSTPDINLLGCFDNRTNGENNLISLSQDKHMIFCSLMEKVISSKNNNNHNPVEMLANILHVLNILYESCIDNKGGLNQQTKLPQQPNQLKTPVSQLITYINNHLSDDLSLDALEKQSYLNKNYLCKLFKDQMGSTIHSYILIRRISLAKEFLEKGASVTEACSQSGFNDYANFIRIFKKITGVSPAKFKSNCLR